MKDPEGPLGSCTLRRAPRLGTQTSGIETEVSERWARIQRGFWGHWGLQLAASTCGDLTQSRRETHTSEPPDLSRSAGACCVSISGPSNLWEDVHAPPGSQKSSLGKEETVGNRENICIFN